MQFSRFWLVFMTIIACTFNQKYVYGGEYFGGSDIYETLQIRGGYIGCLYKDVCLNQEICVDDDFVGRCISTNILNAGEYMELPESSRLKLENSKMHAFAKHIPWGNLYTQCFFRSLLYFPQEILETYGMEYLCGDPPSKKSSESYGDSSPEFFGERDLTLPVFDKENVDSYRNNFLLRQMFQHSGKDNKSATDFEYEFGLLENKKRPEEKMKHDLRKKDIYLKRRYVLDMPSEPQTDKPLMRSWLWIQMNSPLKDGDAGKYLSELSNRLHLASPIRSYFHDRSGYILHFQVPKSSGVDPQSVFNSIKQGKGNFYGHAVVNIGFGRGTPIIKATSHGSLAKQFPLSLAVCFSVVGFIILICFVYTIYKVRRIYQSREHQREHQATLVDVESMAKLRKAGAKKKGIVQRLKSYFEAKCVPEKMTEEKKKNARTDSLMPILEDSKGQQGRSSRGTSLSSNNLSFEAKQKQSSINQRNESLGSQRSSTSSWSSEPVSCGIDLTTGHLILSYMEGYLRDEYRLTADWEAVNAYTAEEATPCVDAQKAENLVKNRITAPLPYEQSRVRLRDSENDYINASLLYDHNPRNPVYIATPTPLMETMADFWQMVWEQSSVVIVCLERTNELKPPDLMGSVDLADASVKYWPSEGVEAYGNFEVHLVSEHSSCENYVVRSFYLKNQTTGETRTVTQFHYLTWVDTNLEMQVNPLLEFRRKVNRSFRGLMSPIVVHCVDGSGRTGTYVLLDLVLNRIAKGVKEINIAASLEHLRDQRQAMVQNKEQYEFVFTAVAKEVDAMLKATGQAG